MAPINTKEVEKIANLAHLIFTAEELKRFVPQFQEILDYFKQLEAIPTEDIEPAYHALERETLETPMRRDEVAASLPVEGAIGSAPDQSDEHFRVPAVIED